MYSVRDDPQRAGFPHSDIPGSKLAPNSPRLFAGCHVFHRLYAPRHPPNALILLERDSPLRIQNNAQESCALAKSPQPEKPPDRKPKTKVNRQRPNLYTTSKNKRNRPKPAPIQNPGDRHKQKAIKAEAKTQRIKHTPDKPSGGGDRDRTDDL